MAAGEAWVFDNWRKHRVLNPSPDARIHLVADTAGTAAFWRLVTQGQAENFELPHPNSRLIAFDPAVRPKLMTERFNVWPLMPPSEMEQLAFDLLADLAPADERPESGAAVSAFVSTVIEFCHDWRSLWYLHGDVPEARSQFENIVRRRSPEAASAAARAGRQHGRLRADGPPVTDTFDAVRRRRRFAAGGRRVQCRLVCTRKRNSDARAIPVCNLRSGAHRRDRNTTAQPLPENCRSSSAL